MMVVTTVSRRVGQTTLAISARTCWRNVKGFDLEANVFTFWKMQPCCNNLFSNNN